MNITWVVIGAIIWLSFSGHAVIFKKQNHAKLCMLVWALLSMASMLELFDFPPLFWIFDAHALWHLATVPMTFVWYQFLIRDSFLMATKYAGVDDPQYSNTDDVTEEKVQVTPS